MWVKENERQGATKEGPGPPSPNASSRATRDRRLRAIRGRRQSALDLADIQGLIVCGDRMPMVRHFLLTVGTPADARRQLGRLVSGDESDTPQITTAADWHVGSRPDPATIPGGPRASPTTVSTSVSRGPDWWRWRYPQRVPTSPSSRLAPSPKEPRNERSWSAISEQVAAELVGGFGKGHDHVLVTLHAISPEAMQSYSDRVCAWFAEGDAFREIWRQDGMALMEMQDGQPVPTSKIHFGYTDGISRTTIRGGPEKYPHDHRRPCQPWLSCCGKRRELQGAGAAKTRRERQLWVFKKIETDVVGFENSLQSNKDKIDPELLAAKMCGQWRNSIPLALSPDTDSPAGDIARTDERFRVRECRWLGRSERDPLSRRRTHTPRQSPGSASRGTGGPGGSNNSHRLMRCLLPYGPTYDPRQPSDGVEQGILG